jgi:rhodanese-related sulfurtransferase
MTHATITPDMKMEEILRLFPSAQRALFQRYHVGGCSACAFQPTETLAEVCKDHNILDVRGVIEHLERSDEVDRRMQVDAAEVRGWLDEGRAFRFVDVRMPGDRERAPFELAEPLDWQNNQQYLALPKDTRIVFACQDGQKSLDVAAYFAGHGFADARSLRGGIDAWPKG